MGNENLQRKNSVQLHPKNVFLSHHTTTQPSISIYRKSGVGWGVGGDPTLGREGLFCSSQVMSSSRNCYPRALLYILHSHFSHLVIQSQCSLLPRLFPMYHSSKGEGFQARQCTYLQRPWGPVLPFSQLLLNQIVLDPSPHFMVASRPTVLNKQG